MSYTLYYEVSCSVKPLASIKDINGIDNFRYKVGCRLCTFYWKCSQALNILHMFYYIKKIKNKKELTFWSWLNLGSRVWIHKVRKAPRNTFQVHGLRIRWHPSSDLTKTRIIHAMCQEIYGNWHLLVYPSMPLKGRKCIPACLLREGNVSQHASYLLMCKEIKQNGSRDYKKDEETRPSTALGKRHQVLQLVSIYSLFLFLK